MCSGLEYRTAYLARSLTGMKLANSIDHAKLMKDILILWLTYRWPGSVDKGMFTGIC